VYRQDEGGFEQSILYQFVCTGEMKVL